MDNNQNNIKTLENDFIQNPAEIEQSQSDYIRALEMAVQLLQREVENLRSQNKTEDNTKSIKKIDAEPKPEFNFNECKTNNEVLSKLHDSFSGQFSIIESNIYFFTPLKRLTPVSDSETSTTLNNFTNHFEEEGIIDWVIERKSPNVIPNLGEEPEGIRTYFILVPLFLRGNAIGMFIARTSREPSTFALEDMNILKAISESAAIALDNIRSSEEIFNMNKRLSTLNKQMFYSSRLASIGELAGTIANEITNPLGIIKGHFKLLESGVGEQNMRYKIINKQIVLIDEIIKRLSAIAESSSADIPPSVINLANLADEVLLFTNSQLQRDNIKVEKEFDSTEITILGIKTQLEQVLLGILLNARDSMPDGGKISISIYKNKTANITISDNGIGISENELNDIFEPYYSMRPDKKSLGTNIYMIKNIIEQHKGILSVNSEVGKGTSYKITLPLFKQKSKVSK
ncbi:MAG: ATP-binding protein [FCB group bacterium]|jgi:signal transduction histidine kinase